MISIKQMCQMTQRYAETVGNIKKDAKIEEICDFGDAYGFLFESEDKYANLYWCITKDNYKPYTFRPNMDVKKYMSRKVLPTDIVR